MKKMLVFCVFLTIPSVLYARGFEVRRLPVAPCAPVQSEYVVESQTIPPGQILAETATDFPQTVSPNPIETQENTDISAKEAELAEREKAIEEREKAVEKREAALADWYAKLDAYREYLNGFQAKQKTQTVVRPTYSTFSYGGTCANGQCYGGW